MSGIRIDWTALEQAFENHAPDIRSYLDRRTGEVIVLVGSSHEGDPAAERIRQRPEDFLRIEPVPSREQYQMMETFIETVTLASLKEQLCDAIVGKGAFRRFKDTVGLVPDERNRWFAFREVLLHRLLMEWVQQQRLDLDEAPEWSLDLPEPGTVQEEDVEIGTVPAPRENATELAGYLSSWARAHGEEYGYLFGPAAFEQLARDMAQEFSVYKRQSDA